MRPLVVIENPAADAGALLRDYERRGWRVVQGWAPGAFERVICTGVVASAGDAADAVLAAVRGAGVVVVGAGPRDVLDALCDDLRRLGPLDHRAGPQPERPVVGLGPDEAELLRLLAQGMTLGAAAKMLFLSRRTADRRLAAAREALGVTTTAEVLVAARRLGLLD